MNWLMGDADQTRKVWICKFDLEKAYDKVGWDFLHLTMEKKCFGKRWIQWIMGCLDQPRFLVMINSL